MIKDRLGCQADRLQLPIGAESDFQRRRRPGESMKAIVWEDESPRRRSSNNDDIPGRPGQDRAQEYREALIETAVEQDEEAMEAYLEGEEPDEETLKAPDPQGHDAEVEFVPVLCGSALRTRACSRCSTPWLTTCRPARRPGDQAGVPEDRMKMTAAQESTTSRCSMLAFKIMNDPFVGSLTFCRGSIPARWNPARRL